MPPFWNGGTSFGGVISFIFADLIIVPVIIIYARYYGRRVAMFSPPATLYATMVTAGYFIELLFAPLHIIPSGPRHAAVGEAGVRWNYTTWLNIIFLVLAAALVLRFLSTGGRQMLAIMGGGPTT